MSLLIDSIVSLSRLTKDPDNPGKESYAPNEALQRISCQLQPATPEETAIAEGVFGQTYMMFTTTSGIFSGDKISVNGSNDLFRVRGVENWNQIEGIPHYEITLVRLLEEGEIY